MDFFKIFSTSTSKTTSFLELPQLFTIKNTLLSITSMPVMFYLSLALLILMFLSSQTDYIKSPLLNNIKPFLMVSFLLKIAYMAIIKMERVSFPSDYSVFNFENFIFAYYILAFFILFLISFYSSVIKSIFQFKNKKISTFIERKDTPLYFLSLSAISLVSLLFSLSLRNTIILNPSAYLQAFKWIANSFTVAVIAFSFVNFMKLIAPRIGFKVVEFTIVNPFYNTETVSIEN